MRALLIAALSLAAAVARPVAAQTPAPYVAPDYRQDGSWLCRPGRADACAADIAATTVTADGKTRVIASAPANARAPIDCFYVYPTVSTDATAISDMSIDAAESNVAKLQFAPFRTVCRTFAPMYRQVTMRALRDELLGRAGDIDRVTGYQDVVAAWNDYLARDNGGRGVVLIGHSQGSRVLKALLQNEIEGKPVARQLIAAYIPGINVLVPAGRDSGGDFKSTPLCRSAGQTGCVLSWVSFRDGKVPPADSRFGRTSVPGMTVACTNPAALPGGRAPLAALLPASADIVGNGSPQGGWAKDALVTTPFVTVPGLLSGACTPVDGAHVLAIRTDGDPADPRTDTIGGDVTYGDQIVEGWGLHLIDVNAVLGDLVTLAEAQGNAWRKSRGSRQ